MQFESKINLGHILTAFGLLVAGTGAYYDVKKVAESNAAQILILSRDNQELNSRLRVQEINSASQTSNLVNIQSSVSRIEAKLDKITGG